MSIFIIILPITCVLARALLNVIDRYLLTTKGLDVHDLQWVNTVCPLLLGIFIWVSLLPINTSVSYFLTIECFVTSVLMHIVSYAFSFSFKKHNLRQVVITSKWSELLLLPLLSLTLSVFFSETLFKYTKTGVHFALVCSCLLLYTYRDSRNWNSLLHPTLLFLAISLALQIYFCALMSKGILRTLEQGCAFTLGILAWRSLFSTLILLYRKGRLEGSLLRMQSISHIFLRSGVMLISYLTFVFSIELNQPLMVFPIINLSPLVASILAQVMLKESLAPLDLTVLIGLSVAAIL